MLPPILLINPAKEIRINRTLLPLQISYPISNIKNYKNSRKNNSTVFIHHRFSGHGYEGVFFFSSFFVF